MDDLRAWRWLMMVVDLGGLAAAAKQAHRTPSTLSHAIKTLESQVGVPLVKYHGRHLALTEAGRSLTERLRPVLRDLDGAKRLVEQLRGGVEPLVSLAIDQIVPPERVCALLHQLAQTHPTTRVELFETVLGGGPARMQAGLVDAYIGTHNVPNTVRQALGSVSLVAVAARTHPLAVRQEQSAAPLNEPLLRQHRQIVIRDSAPGRLASGSWLAAEQRYTVDHLHTAVGLVRAGLGFSWLPDFILAREPSLVGLPLPEGMCETLTLAWTERPGFSEGAAGRVIFETAQRVFQLQ